MKSEYKQSNLERIGLFSQKYKAHTPTYILNNILYGHNKQDQTMWYIYTSLLPSLLLHTVLSSWTATDFIILMQRVLYYHQHHITFPTTAISPEGSWQKMEKLKQHFCNNDGLVGIIGRRDDDKATQFWYLHFISRVAGC